MTLLASSRGIGPDGDDLSALSPLLQYKRTTTVSVCIPARDEAATITSVVEMVASLGTFGLVDEIVVVDDGSTDGTAARARTSGAQVVSTLGRGKGAALSTAASAARGDLLVFLDADVTNYTPSFLGRMIAPLLLDASIQIVKGSYRRSCNGQHGEGGRVTELLARPLLERFHPELAAIIQPLAGETGIRRSALGRVTLTDGYGIEIGLLIDVYLAYGIRAIAEAELDERIHRNRPLHELAPIARDVLQAVLDRPPSSTRWARRPW